MQKKHFSYLFLFLLIYFVAPSTAHAMKRKKKKTIPTTAHETSIQDLPEECLGRVFDYTGNDGARSHQDLPNQYMWCLKIGKLVCKNWKSFIEDRYFCWGGKGQFNFVPNLEMPWHEIESIDDERFPKFLKKIINKKRPLGIFLIPETEKDYDPEIMAQKLSAIINLLEKFSRTIRIVRSRGMPNINNIELPEKFENLEELELHQYDDERNRWALTLIEKCKKLTHIKTVGCEGLYDNDLVRITRKFPKLKHLDLSACSGIEGRNLQDIPKMPDMKYLSIQSVFGYIDGQMEIRDEGIYQLVSKMPNLEHLNLYGCEDLGDKAFEAITNLKDLKFLEVTCAHVTKAGFRHMHNKFKKLEHLLIIGADNLTDEAMKCIGTFKNLKSLELIDCSDITNQGIMEISKLEKLEKLYLDDIEPHINNESFVAITNLKNLKLLVLDCKDVTEACFIDRLHKLRKIKHLNISGGNGVTDTVMWHIGMLQNLRSLHISDCNNITDDGLMEILRLENLESLHICDCRSITNEGLRRLKQLKENLDLKVTGFYPVGYYS